MIIWRGWGIVAVAFIAAAGNLGIGVPFSVWGESAKWVLIPVALLAGAGCWFTGRYLNVTRPRRLAEEEVPRVRAQVAAAVENGTFRLPNQPMPTSLDEARGQATSYLAFLEAGAKVQTNRHTLFFIPVQYWAILIAVLGTALPFLLR